MGFVIFKKDGLRVMRFPCSCLHVAHNIDVAIDNDIEDRVYIGASVDSNLTIWDRIKSAFRMLVGQQVCMGEAILNEKEAQDLQKFLKENLPQPFDGFSE